MSKILWKKTAGMNTVSFEKKITGVRRLEVYLQKHFRKTYLTNLVSPLENLKF